MKPYFTAASYALAIGSVAALCVDFTGTVSNSAKGVGGALQWVGDGLQYLAS